MSPPNDDRRPRQEAPPPTTTANIPSLRERFCNARIYQRRCISRLLDEILADLYPHQPPPPSTFGLTPEELSRHVQTLLNAGWTIGEVGVVIDLRQVA